MNAHCVWTNDAARPLDPRRAADQRHLLNDVTVAEDLAIRHADATRGRRSGHYAGAEEYAETREQCLVALFDRIADAHRIDALSLRSLLHRRPIAFDLVGVLLPAALLFCAAADTVVRRVHRRFAADERAALAVSLVVSSIVLVGAGYLAGTLWSLLFEQAIRLRTNHLSYRAFYLPWSRHTIAVLAAETAIFWTTVLARRRWPERRAWNAMVESGFASVRVMRTDRTPSGPGR